MQFARETWSKSRASKGVIENDCLTLPCESGRVWEAPHNGGSKGKCGFTLIEIMIAMSIAMIMMAIGIPAFVRSMKKEGLRRAVSDMVEACSNARTQSILKGNPMELVIRAEDMSLSVQSAPRNNDGWFSPRLPGPGVGGAESGTPAGARFSSQFPDGVAVKLLYVNLKDKMELPEARVRFYPNGTCDEFTIILYSGEGERKISLDVVTGLSDLEVIR
ncbi:MAG: prepilin-type N-terminal cleavage/methylation domain-containing protein [Verrucomicrobia bacterium]|nr:prepilin-type N-terminal cleavage/methylation domain-containing protein [Verrucomicrobiota bacterium]